MALARDIDTRKDDAYWCEIDDLDRDAVDPGLLSLLTCPDYLTNRLRSLCDNRFRLRLLDQRPARDGALLREIVMYCDTVPMVYGQTLAPAGTLRSQGWLHALGDRSVGDHLRSLEQVTRGPLEFARLTASHRLHRRARTAIDDDGTLDLKPLWARRSLFSIGACPLLVNEVFFPGAVECARP